MTTLPSISRLGLPIGQFGVRNSAALKTPEANTVIAIHDFIIIPLDDEVFRAIHG